MSAQLLRPGNLGEMICAEFDKAARFSADPREVSRLATQAVSHLLLLRARRTLMSPALCSVHRANFPQFN